MNELIAFTAIIVIGIGLMSIGSGLQALARAVLRQSRVTLDLTPLVEEFQRWMRIHYMGEKP